MEKNPMTKEGFESLKIQLDFLKRVKRVNIINDIKKARAHGDLKENAEYHSAKEEQYLIEKKIKEIENKILNAHIIEIKNAHISNKILFGSTIELINLENNKTYSYKIVGEDESNIKANKLSIKSPLARALIQKSIGDIINVTVPNGIIKYKIINIKYT